MPNLVATFITMSEEPLRAWLESSIIKRALKQEILSVHIEEILKSVKNHHEVDDTPYGGGPGELMKINIIAPLINKALQRNPERDRQKKRVLLMDPAGIPFSQEHAERLQNYEELIFIAGRYEGIDARVYNYIDEAISLGDFVLSNGDLAALAIFDATARLIDGVLGNKNSVLHESHQQGRLESSHYTRPVNFEGHEVPLVLQSGNHALIEKARKIEGLQRTLINRADLIEKYPLSAEEKVLLEDCEKNFYPWQKTP